MIETDPVKRLQAALDAGIVTQADIVRVSKDSLTPATLSKIVSGHSNNPYYSTVQRIDAALNTLGVTVFKSGRVVRDSTGEFEPASDPAPSLGPHQATEPGTPSASVAHEGRTP